MPANPVMSINADVDHASREDQAALAGHMIYNRVHGPGDPLLPPPILHSTFPDSRDMSQGFATTASLVVDPIAQGKLSSVRRTFCLFVLFDLILMFILWVIYTQLIGDTGYKAFERQVANYGFKTSLFDSVMLSAVRFVFLLLVYALYKSNHWWMVAVTTALSCGVLIAKIFVFDFEGSNSTNNPLSYVLIIVSFTLAWIETWFLDFKVLPAEKKLLARLNARTGRAYGTLYGGDQYRRLYNDDVRSQYTDDNQFYSPLETPEGSDTEEGPTRERRPKPPAATTASGVSTAQGTSRQENDYIRLGKHAWDVLWTYITSDEADWKKESGKDLDVGIVHSKKIKDVGKVFRLSAILDIHYKALFNDINNNPENQPNWNQTVKESKIIQVVDENTDILYNLAADLAGGAISSRDFVTLRTWGEREGIMVGAGLGVKHPEMPPQKAYVRGTNGVGGFVYKPNPDDPNTCLFNWYTNTDIGGWFPRKLIDANMAKVLLDFVKDIKVRITELKETNA